MFALTGFYAALTPGLLSERLHQTSHVLAGAVVVEMFFVSVISMLATRRLKSRTTMLIGMAWMPPSASLLALAWEFHSMPLLLACTALGGVSIGLGYRGSLQVADEIAPGKQRAEVISTYYIFCYVGVALLVIGVGVLSQLVSPVIANITFGGTVALFAVVALAAGIRYAPRPH